jgi:ABC-type nitrate/sulfonate/bicarbonate transport system substrate-binding protein
MFNEPQATIAVRKFGMQPLIDLMEGKTPFPQNCFIVKRSYLEANREKVGNFMKAVIEAIYLLKKDRPLALRLIKKYIRVSDEEAARLRLLPGQAQRGHLGAARPARPSVCHR